MANILDETKKPKKVDTGLEPIIAPEETEMERRRANPSMGLPLDSQEPPRETPSVFRR